jgi:hypothetical protein
MDCLRAMINPTADIHALCSISRFGLFADFRCDCERRLIEFCAPMSALRDLVCFRCGCTNGRSREIGINKSVFCGCHKRSFLSLATIPPESLKNLVPQTLGETLFDFVTFLAVG